MKLPKGELELYSKGYRRTCYKILISINTFLQFHQGLSKPPPQRHLTSCKSLGTEILRTSIPLDSPCEDVISRCLQKKSFLTSKNTANFSV